MITQNELRLTNGIGELKAVSYDQRLLELSWNWLNDPEISYLTMTPPFTKSQQLSWFESLPTRPDYLIWGIELDGKPIGVFGLKNLNADAGEYWGYIGDKSCWGKGIGQWIMAQVVIQAKQHRLQRLYLKVLTQNTRAVKLYLKCGFVIKSEKADVKWMEYEIK